MMVRAATCMMMVCLASAALAAPAKDAAKDSAKESAKDAPKETAKPAVPPVPAAPERTTASFGDWVLRCETPPSPAARACEVALIIAAQNQAGTVAQVAIGRGAADGRPITIVLPHNISLLRKPQVALAKPGTAPLDFTWQRCTPGACFASTVLSGELATNFGAQTEAGKITYRNAAEQDVVLPLSFRGLAQAMEAMAKEP